jgi:predicted Rossmann fold flavoprotein
MERYKTAIIGGGAAGLCAAISAGRRDEPVIILEKTDHLGKKILASGNGRCNLLNDDFREEYYNPAARELVRSVISRYGKEDILGFFKELGLLVHSHEGRIFPVTNQAASVLKVLEMELRRLRVSVEYNFDCCDISPMKDGFQILSRNGKRTECKKVVITGGGKTYPVFGSDGSIYEVVRRLGHTIVEPVPSVVPLVVKDNLCFLLQGQRISARARAIVGDRDGVEASGELLFTKYGLSGTCILDISDEISTALNRYRRTDVWVVADMAPFIERDQLQKELERRQKAKWPVIDMTTGLLPNKFGLALKDVFEKSDIETAARVIKERRFKVTGTRGWNEAEFTSGGVSADEVEPGTLESRLQPGIYFAGEVLDVNGKRGGYNLGWAWASGLTAGQPVQ